jgi:molybdate transport system substrate-binding protein
MAKTARLRTDRTVSLAGLGSATRRHRPGRLLATLSFLLFSGLASALDLHVMNSGAFSATYKALQPGYEKQSGNHLVTAWGPSMGESPNAIPKRLERGEPADLVILAGPALDELIRRGKVRPGSRVDLVRSRIALAVRAGAPRPDISTVEALKQALLNARSIAYSDSASGVYLSRTLFPRLGIAEQIRTKSRMIEAVPVGGVVAAGEAELGFQQLSELLPVPGIDIVGVLPGDAQRVTLFSAGIPVSAAHPEAAQGLVAYLKSKEAEPVIISHGLEPVSGP